jgi:hypothetical protein
MVSACICFFWRVQTTPSYYPLLLITSYDLRAMLAGVNARLRCMRYRPHGGEADFGLLLDVVFLKKLTP